MTAAGVSTQQCRTADPMRDATDTTQEASRRRIEPVERRPPLCFTRAAAEHGHQHLVVVWRKADMFTNR
jgi:hypothetical protein